MRRYRFAKMIFLFIVIAPIAILVFGGIVMWLWNNALVPVLHVSTVTFWQALGILVLSKILFSSFGGGRSHRYSNWRERMSRKWQSMTPEERERFKERWKNRWWKDEFKPWESESSGEQTSS